MAGPPSHLGMDQLCSICAACSSCFLSLGVCSCTTVALVACFCIKICHRNGFCWCTPALCLLVLYSGKVNLSQSKYLAVPTVLSLARDARQCVHDLRRCVIAAVIVFSSAPWNVLPAHCVLVLHVSRLRVWMCVCVSDMAHMTLAWAYIPKSCSAFQRFCWAILLGLMCEDVRTCSTQLYAVQG